MFVPQQVLIEEKALQYPKGKAMEAYFKRAGVPIRCMKSARVKLSGETAGEKYANGKNTLVIGVRKVGAFQSCKPSAHFQLPLVSGCMGMCEYCYLHTQMAKRPYVKVYANTEEILGQADRYIDERLPETTIFEGAATSDPLALEPFTRSLEEAILHFAKTPNGRFRFVSKYADVDSLLRLDHQSHTEIRLSLNIDAVISAYEHRTPPLQNRLRALEMIADAGYPAGIIIAPVFWNAANKARYQALLKLVGPLLARRRMTVEVISHRFTSAAKNNIQRVFPDTTLPMREEDRRYQFGQFGYGKFVYDKEDMQAYKDFFRAELEKHIPAEQILYII